jgi:hypothetical protein
MTESEAPAEEQAQKQKQMPFTDILAVHRRNVDVAFPKSSEEARVRISVAFFEAQIALINTQTLGQALGLPEKQELVLALNEEREHRVKLERRLAQVETAYHEVQKLAQGRLKS